MNIPPDVILLPPYYARRYTMIVSVEALRNYITAWWQKYDTQEKYDSAPERGPDITSFILTHYNSKKLADLDFTGFNFSGCNLSYLDLTGSIFDDVDFENASFFASDLSRAKLNNSKNLNKAAFSNAKLCDINLSGCELSGINLSSTDISGSDFSYACFENGMFIDIDFNTAIITDANFSRSQMDKISLESILPTLLDEGVIYTSISIKFIFEQLKNDEKAELLEKILPLVKKKKICLVGIDLSYVDLTGLKLCDLNFMGVNFTGANLSNANLSNCNLTRSKLNRAKLVGTNLCKIRWAHCDLQGTVFTDVIGIKGSQIYTALNIEKCRGLPPHVLEEIKTYRPQDNRSINDFFKPVSKRKNEPIEETMEEVDANKL